MFKKKKSFKMYLKVREYEREKARKEERKED